MIWPSLWLLPLPLQWTSRSPFSSISSKAVTSVGVELHTGISGVTGHVLCPPRHTFSSLPLILHAWPFMLSPTCLSSIPWIGCCRSKVCWWLPGCEGFGLHTSHLRNTSAKAMAAPLLMRQTAHLQVSDSSCISSWGWVLLSEKEVQEIKADKSLRVLLPVLAVYLNGGVSWSTLPPFEIQIQFA